MPSRQRKGHGRVTLEEVAALAGVTAITVSRFLRQPAVVAEPTAERIRAALAQSGYVPNKQAGQLASGRSNMVAALLPNLANSIFAETVQGLSEGLQAAGLELMLASTDYSLQREEEQLRAVLGWSPAALVVTGRQHSDGGLKLMQGARDQGVPVIEIWDHQGLKSPPFAQIGFSHDAVGRAMAGCLTALGHRHLLYVDSGVSADVRAHERGAGFVAAAKLHGARVRSINATPGDAFDAGRLALRQARAARAPHATAIAFANDHLACGALLEARAVGLRLPEDVALLGFGDFTLARHIDPGLSTVRLPRREIGLAAARSLLQALEHAAPPPSKALAWELVPRGTT